MKTAKNLAIDGVFTALLIGSQFVLSSIKGLEIVTILLLSFALVYKLKDCLIVVNSYILIRTFIFGFYLNVTILYIVYYNLFVVICYFSQKIITKYTIKNHIKACILTLLLVILFTALDDVISPIIYGFTFKSFKMYAYASIFTLIPQLICNLVTSITLFAPLYLLFKKI